MSLWKRSALLPALVLTLLLPVSARAQQDTPPAKVVVAPVRAGEVSPTTGFIGTVYFSERSDVACEVAGKVVRVAVDDGATVRRDDVLVELSTDILDRSIQAAEADMGEARASYELARLDAQRIEELYQSKSVAKGEYDTKRLTARAAQRRMSSLQAVLERLRLERRKKIIRAPYDAVILDTPVDRGEWVNQGDPVVSLARDDEYDVVVNVPGEVLRTVRPGEKVGLRVGAATVEGEIYAAIPEGDVATRTFPVKIRVHNTVGLAQGMEVGVTLPTGDENRTLIVPRDAIIAQQGQLVVFAAVEDKAQPFPVHVIGYQGMTAGVRSDGLEEGMLVVVKGNERLRTGQPLSPERAP